MRGMFFGVVQCVDELRTRVEAIATAQLFVQHFLTEHADLVNASVVTLRADVAAVQSLVAKAQSLPSKKASDLSAADQVALVAAVGKLRDDQV